MKEQTESLNSKNYEIAALYNAGERNPNLDIALLQSGIAFFLMANSVYDSIEDFFNKKLKISQAKFGILMYLSTEAKSGLTQSELVKRWKVSPSAISNRIDGLEKNGFVKREKSTDDKREKIITITPQGQNLFDHALVEYSQWLSKIVGKFEKTAQENFTYQAEQIRNLFIAED